MMMKILLSKSIKFATTYTIVLLTTNGQIRVHYQTNFSSYSVIFEPSGVSPGTKGNNNNTAK